MSKSFAFERLTPRQREVIIRKAEGKTYGQVAYELGVTEQTVKNHLRLVYAKLGAEHLIEALRILGWLRLPGESHKPPPDRQETALHRSLLVELERWTVGADERGRPRQPFRRVVAVVRVLARFDPVEEDLVDQRLAGARDRGKEGSSPIGIGAGDRGSPGDQPVGAHLIDCSWRDPIEKRRHVEHRMPDARVAPVEQD